MIHTLGAARLRRLHFSSTDTGPEEFFELWRHSVSPLFRATPTGNGDGLKNRAYTCCQIHANEFLLVEARTPQQHFLRDTTWLRRHDDVDHLILEVYLSGRNFTTCGETEYIEDGTVSLVNLAYRSEGFATASHFLSLVLPRDLIRQHLPHLASRRGNLFSAGSIANRLLTGHLLTMRREMEGATGADVPMLTAGLVGLVEALTARPGDTEAEAVQPVLFETIKTYIKGHLGDAGLNSEHLARRFRLSRATLFRLFREVGGVSAYIQQERLSACFRAFADPQLASRPIYHVAGDFGLTNASHLSTQFRCRFGTTPREVRQGTLRASAGVNAQPDGHSVGGEADEMRRWMLALGK
ncbi:helix-turn-helix domain-containing protein [Stappia sp. ES.058]|uniref:helix-turn-helix domain-containing protein n=1 Tax=Stappia sp. ES.058 TaxID=1881061 RepID=UPI00087A60BC|nr:helix-turn-helix domain-containing protein [Stappia sp. ES.058]SDU15402.1 transcriptional regulator, AraC family [Stappia sp. ES.058]